MSLYLLVKWLHILSAMLLLGTGLGTAYFMFFANRCGDVAAQAVVARLVVRADAWFTAPAVVIQPATGLWLAQAAGLDWRTPWLALSIGLFILAGACWLPVLWLQLRMAALAREAARQGRALPPAYARLALWWELLGYPAFAAMLAVTYLMVVKPSLGA